MFALPSIITIPGENAESITLASPECLVATRQAEPFILERRSCIRGISVGVARALLRAGLPHFAMAVEILTDLGYAEKVISRSEFIQALDGLLSKNQAREAFDEWAKQPSERSPEREVSEKTAALMDFVGELSTNNIYKYLSMDNSHTNSAPRKKGRPPKAMIYVPSEADLRAALKSAGFISGDMTIPRDTKLQGEFSTWSLKKLDVFKKTSLYKDFIFGYQVYQHGKDKYSRKQLTDPIGDTPRNARRRARRLGFDVTPNDPELILLSDDNYQLLVPKDEETRLRWVANHRCTENDHIRNSKVGRKRFDFTWEGYRQAKESSWKSRVWKARDQMSTYDLGECNWYTTENDRNAQPVSTNQCAFVKSNYLRCGDYATEDGSPFCKKHAHPNRAKRSEVSYFTTWDKNFPLPIEKFPAVPVEKPAPVEKPVAPARCKPKLKYCGPSKLRKVQPGTGTAPVSVPLVIDFARVYGPYYDKRRNQGYDEEKDFQEFLEIQIAQP